MGIQLSYAAIRPPETIPLDQAFLHRIRRHCTAQHCNCNCNCNCTAHLPPTSCHFPRKLLTIMHDPSCSSIQCPLNSQSEENVYTTRHVTNQPRTNENENALCHRVPCFGARKNPRVLQEKLDLLRAHSSFFLPMGPWGVLGEKEQKVPIYKLWALAVLGTSKRALDSNTFLPSLLALLRSHQSP